MSSSSRAVMHGSRCSGVSRREALRRRRRPSCPASSSRQASAHYTGGLVERSRLVATPLQERLVGDTRHRLLLLMAAVGCVLLVVCANLANLMLARVTGRQPEFAIRSALGARTGRLVRMILTESLLLAAFGAVGALLLAYWGNGVLRSMLAARVSHVETVPIDWWVLSFNTMLAAATGVLSGLASLMPIRSRDFASATRRADRSVTSRTGLRRSLLAAEVAIVFALVLTAALLSQTLWHLHHSKRGFSGDHLLTAGVMPGMSGTIPRNTESDLDLLQPRDRADRSRSWRGVGGGCVHCAVRRVRRCRCRECRSWDGHPPARVGHPYPSRSSLRAISSPCGTG